MYNPAQEVSSIDFGAIIGGSLNAVISAQSQSANTTVDFIKNVGFNTTTTKDENGNEIESHTPIGVAFTYDKVTAPAQVLTGRTATAEIISGGSGYKDSNISHYTLKSGDKEIQLASVEVKDGAVTAVQVAIIPNDITDDDLKSCTLEYKNGEDTASDASIRLTAKQDTVQVPATVQKMQIEVPILTMMPIPFIKIAHADINFNVKINSVSSTNTSNTSNVKTDASFSSRFFGKTSLSASFSNQKSSSSSEEVKKDYSLNIDIHAVQDDMPAGVSRILDILEESITPAPAA